MDAASDSLPPKARRLRTLFDRDHRLTKKEIGERLGCCARHARRLVDALREAGIPVADEKDPANRRAKRFYLPTEHQRRSLVLDELDEEALYALTVAAQAAEGALSGTALHAPLRRAFAMLLNAYSHEDIFLFDEDAQAEAWHFGALAAAPVEAGVWQAVTTAIDRGHGLRVDYLNGAGERSFKRLLDPLALAPLGGVWLLAAFCHQRQAVRDFNLARVSNAKAFPERRFDRPAGFDPHTHFAGRFGALAGQERYSVRLRVAPERAVYFESKRYHPSQTAERSADGALLVTFQVRTLDPVRAFVASWGPSVVALAPPELADRLAADAAETVRAYRDLP